jgi:hypothetical protein
LGFTRTIGVDLAEHDTRALGDESFDDAPTDATTAAGDDCDFAGEQFRHEAA